MTQDNYMSAIRKAKNLITELLNEPDCGKLTFNGRGDLDDLTITGPDDLNRVVIGTVIAISGEEWMCASMGDYETRQWRHCMSGRHAASEELYILALETNGRLTYCHEGI